MRIRLRHETTFDWDRPVRGLIQSLRVTPRDHEAQHVLDWRIGPNVDCRLAAQEDAFGNIVHSCAAEGPLTQFTLTIEGLVMTSDVAGIVRHGVERFPPELYLRDTPATAADPRLRAFAAEASAGAADPLDALHRLMAAVHEGLTRDEALPERGAAGALEAGGARLSDMVEVMIAGARHLGTPARYVSGYLVAEDSIVEHAWMEGHVPGFGWVGFDPLLDLCPQEAHVRVAIGLDALGARPVRSAVHGFAAEEIASRVVLVGVPDRGGQQQRQQQ